MQPLVQNPEGAGTARTVTSVKQGIRQESKYENHCRVNFDLKTPELEREHKS